MSAFSSHSENTFTWVYISVHAALPKLGAEHSGVFNRTGPPVKMGGWKLDTVFIHLL